MNEFLSDYYGTNDGANYEDPDSLEKMAQLTLLVKEAEENDVDLSDLTEEEALELADELYGGGEAYEEGDFEKEAEAKFEEADYLGRVMAHSMWQELGEIEKEAGKRIDAAKDYATRAGSYLKSKLAPTSIGLRLTGEKKMKQIASKRGLEGQEKAFRTKQYIRDPQTGKIRAEKTSLSTGGEAGKKWAREQTGKDILQTAKRRGQAAYGLAGLTAAGTGGGIYAATRGGKDKKGSAFAKLAEDRALNMLYEAGYIDEYGNVYEPEQEKVASDFDTQLDIAALQMLEEQGWPVQWNQ